MPYDIEQTDSCPASKPFGVVGPNGKVHGCHPSRRAAERQRRALYANEGKSVKTAIKREAGMDFPPRDYAYVPDPMRPATWRLRLTEAPGAISLEQLQRAAAAISPAGFRGNRLEIPQAAASSVKRRLLAEFRRLKVNEADIPASVKSKDRKDDSFFFFKDGTGKMRWFAIYSNHYRDQDNPPEIIAEVSHLSFVDLVDKGLVDFPELWLWHTEETAWGKADWVAYSDGFASASGYVYDGYEDVAEALSKMKDLGVSHGMPKHLLVRDPADESVIIFHVTTEISPLPRWAAANYLTGFAVLDGEGDMEMTLPKEKKEFLERAKVSPETIEAIEQRIGAMSKAAKAAGIASKEAAEAVDDLMDEVKAQVEDDDEWDDDFEGDDDYEDDDENDVESKEGDNDEKVNWNSDRRGRKVNWNSEENMPRKPRKKKPDSDKRRVNWNSDKDNEGGENSEKRRVNWNSDDDGDDDAAARRRRRKPDSDKRRVNWNSDSDGEKRRVNWNSDRNRTHRKKEAGEEEYVTREEIVEALQPFMEEFKELTAQVVSLTKEVNFLRQSDEDRIASVKEVTPTRSLSDMLRGGNPIGQEATRVKGSTTLGKDGPKESEAPKQQATTMVPFIDNLIHGMYANGDNK